MFYNKKRDYVSDFTIGGDSPFHFISGPCVIEDIELLEKTVDFLSVHCKKLEISFIFKSSYDKANRSDVSSYRGPGLIEGLKILKYIKEKYHVPILTDVHEVADVSRVAEVADIIQIPAFLCRQTDLIMEVAKTQKWMNIKKGQFMAPLDALKIIEKVHSVGNTKVTICERGYTFGYNNLVVDMRSIEILRKEGVYVIMDATHATQLPGGGLQSGGQREMAFPLARAAAAVGVDGFFMESHPNPLEAKSDSTNQIFLKEVPFILETLKKIDHLVKNNNTP